MRLSSANAYDASLDTLMKRQSDLVDTQTSMTSGKRVNRASDDPAAAARIERAVAAQAKSVASQRAVDASSNAMTLTEGALGDAISLMQQVREALVSAGNASLGDSERATLGDQIASLRKQLLSVANRTDGAGTSLFGGQGPGQAPFSDGIGGVRFQGTAGQTQVASGEGLPMSMDGGMAWMQGRSGNGVFETAPAAGNTGTGWIDTGSVSDATALTGAGYSVAFSTTGGATTYSVLKDGTEVQAATPYTSGQAIRVDGMAFTVTGAPADGDRFDVTPSSPSLSVFDALDKAVADLKTPLRNNGQIAQANSSNLARVDAALNQLQSARSAAGETLNRIDGVTSRLSAEKLAATTDQSNAENVDMTQVISDFSNKQSGYNAALKAYSMVQRLSLFQYISG